MSETWLNENFSDGLLLYNYEYSIVCKDRKKKEGGRVCIFLHRSINYFLVPLPLEFEHIKALCVDLHCNSTKQRVLWAYIPKRVDLYYLTCLTKCLKVMCDIDYTLSVCGDFNLSEYD